MKATQGGGKLVPLDCTIFVPPNTDITLKALPDIDDTKQANYEADEGIGRTQPFMTYKNSGFRQINIGLHFFVTDQEEIQEIWGYIRALQSIVYPQPGQNGAPYAPPPICSIHCGDIFKDTNGGDICAVCTSVGVKYDTTVAWDEDTYLPWKVDVTTAWQVVYANSELPGADQILQLGQQ